MMRWYARPQPYNCVWFQVLPPPNVTGALHIGHALTVSIQVCLSPLSPLKRCWDCELLVILLCTPRTLLCAIVACLAKTSCGCQVRGIGRFLMLGSVLTSSLALWSLQASTMLESQPKVWWSARYTRRPSKRGMTLAVMPSYKRLLRVHVPASPLPRPLCDR